MNADSSGSEPAWLHGHPHEPNLTVPAGDGSFTLTIGATAHRITVADLWGLPFFEIESCTIVSTGHGASGPFRFGGVRLVDFLARLVRTALTDPAVHPVHPVHLVHVDIIGADGFGTRLTRAELAGAPSTRPPLLALTRDGQPLTRAQGLVRLIVPTEVDDALKQVKWVERILVRLS